MNEAQKARENLSEAGRDDAGERADKKETDNKNKADEEGAMAFSAQDLILAGHARHKRLRPMRNAFSYGVYTVRLALRARAAREAAGTLRDTRIFAHNRFGLLSFHDRDHLGPEGEGASALEWIESVLRKNGIHDADGEIYLHAFPRVMGYVFNPVSFWLCERADGALRAILCEVRNTFGERHCYLLAPGGPILNGVLLSAKKEFHVSPFFAVEGEYDFRFMSVPPKAGKPFRFLARIDHKDVAGPVLLTSLSGAGRPLRDASALRVFFRYPLMTLGVVAKIHWQALKLFVKRAPFFGKPPPPVQSLTREKK